MALALADSAELDTEPAFRLAWLAPASFALLLAAVLYNQQTQSLATQMGNSGSLVAAALSNQSVAAWVPGSFQPQQNRLPAESLEWTNGRGSSSSVHPASGRAARD